MMKEDPGVSKAQAWGCPMHRKKYSMGLKCLSLGMPPCIPFSMLYFYHFICYVLCLERLALYFLVYLVLLAVHNKLDPSLHFLGEKHAPLHPRTKHSFHA